jgi:hypothetical protein
MGSKLPRRRFNSRRRSPLRRLLQLPRLRSTSEANRPHCVICEEAFDSPTLSIRVSRGRRAHVLCAALDKVGLSRLARSSGRW